MEQAVTIVRCQPGVVMADQIEGLADVILALQAPDHARLANMPELGDALRGMSDETVAFHVNPTKNGFSNRAGDITKDGKLTHDLSKATTRLQAARSVEEKLAFLQTKLVREV